PATTLLAPTLPLDLDALVVRPVDVRAGRLLFPPGSRFLGYIAVPGPAGAAAPRARRRPRQAPVEAVRFSVTSRVRPPYTDAVAVADFLRSAALSKLGLIRG